MKANRIELNPRAIKVTFPDDDSFSVDLADGRTITVPLAWFPRLLKANIIQRQNVKLNASGEILHWPDVDEDISVPGLLSTKEIFVLPDGDLRVKPNSDLNQTLVR